MPASSILHAILYLDGRLRAPWRISLYIFFFVVLALIGLYAVSMLPREPLDWGSRAASLGAALLAGWIMLSKLDRRPLGVFGFALHRRTLPESLFGLALGAGLIGIGVLALLLTGSAHFVGDDGSAAAYLEFIGWTFLYFALAAAFEEALFRGYPFQVLVEWVGPWRATVTASLLFALLHAQNPSVTPLALANIFLAGVLLSVAYLRTRSLWFVTGVHVGWNWAMASLFDFPVSGLTFDTPVYSGVPTGPELWTGGAFGPEAGIVGTLAFLLGLAAVLAWGRVRPAAEMAELRPLVDARLGAEWPR